MSPHLLKKAKNRRKSQRPVNLFRPAFTQGNRFLPQTLLIGRQHGIVLPAFLSIAATNARHLVRLFTCLTVLAAFSIHANAQNTRQESSQHTAAPDFDVSETGKSVVQVFTFDQPPAADQTLRSINPLADGYGIALDEQGRILTNRHQLANITDSHYRILLPGSSKLIDAEVLAADSWIDLAVLQIKKSQLENRDSNQTESGSDTEWLADQQGNNISDGQQLFVVHGPDSEPLTGISEPYPGLSVAKRQTRFDSLAFDCKFQYGGLLRVPLPRSQQTGTLQEPFNKSGAGVFDRQGNLVGLTTVLVPGPATDSPDQVIIPLDEATWRKVAPMLSGKLAEYSFAGITPRDLSPSQLELVPHGIQVTDVVRNSPAHERLQFSDVVTHLNGVPIHNVDQYWFHLNNSNPFDTIRFSAIRGVLSNPSTPQEIQVDVIVGKRRIETRRPSFQSAKTPRWRGLAVEEPFAMVNFETLLDSVKHQQCVVVNEVQIDSAAWNAGLRPRQVIRQVNGQSVTSRDSFYSLANKTAANDVELTVIDAKTGADVSISVRSTADNR